MSSSPLLCIPSPGQMWEGVTNNDRCQMRSLFPYVISSESFLVPYQESSKKGRKGLLWICFVKNESFCLLKQTFRKKKYGWEKEKVSDLRWQIEPTNMQKRLFWGIPARPITLYYLSENWTLLKSKIIHFPKVKQEGKNRGNIFQKWLKLLPNAWTR